jgi:hypothetical protein
MERIEEVSMIGKTFRNRTLAEMKDYILCVLDTANTVIEETPHIKVGTVRDIRISTFAVAKMIIEADKA